MSRFADILERKKDKDALASSVKGGRESTPEGSSSLLGMVGDLSSIQPDFNVEMLQALEILGKYHADISHAIDNIRELGNTDFTISFDDEVPKSLEPKMISRLTTKGKNWYSYSGGLNALVNDLLGQIALTGALSAEIVPNLSLDGVKKPVIVDPKSIRFSYDKEMDEYKPHQIARAMTTGVGTSKVELNTTTYKYIAISRFGEKPYGIPPFLSALENVSIGRDIQENMKNVVKKLGTLGFLEVLVNGPKPKPNESSDDYYRRTEKYLDKVIPEVEKGLSKGYVAGFKGVHEFNMHSTTTNVEGTRSLVEMNDTKMISGLKQDPLMLGRNFQTTETLGRVILAKMTTQISNYQKTVASFLEQMFLLDLQLGGYNVNDVTVEFAKPMIGDENRKNQAYSTKLNNLDRLLRRGIIDIYQYTVEAGYDKPSDPEKHIEPIVPVDPVDESDEDDETEGDGKTDPDKDVTENIELFKSSLGYGKVSFPYDESCTCSYDKGDDAFEEMVEKYYRASRGEYGKAIDKQVKKIANELSKMGEGATEQQVRDKIYYHLYKDWDKAYTAKQKKVTDKFVSATYKFYRKDKAPLGGKEDLPKGTFSTVDYRAMDYYKDSDKLYLGKFITDDDVNRKVTQFVKDKYLTRELPIGGGKEAINQFRKEFGGLLGQQEWKISQIIDTTVNNLRNTAAVSYMNEAEVTEYKIQGISDNLQCDYCAGVQGMIFKVETAMESIESKVNSDPAYVKVHSQFLTSAYKTPADLKGATGKDLQDGGINHPPFHPHCRDQVIADI